ncbi:MAG TPA: hypothetical protein VEW26_14800 [Allosphingosinicella sp.]|nr:hypothetical protein [Allosphingosinicella sp.]
MKKLTLILAAAGGLAACDVDQTKNGQLPDVDVDVNATGGQLPEFNVTPPEVSVGTENKTVQVPDVDVKVPAENAQ